MWLSAVQFDIFNPWTWWEKITKKKNHNIDRFRTDKAKSQDSEGDKNIRAFKGQKITPYYFTTF